MKKIFNSINFWISSVGRSFAREWSLVLKDIGVLLFFLALPLLYPIAYTLIYNPEVVEQLPVAVVDNSRSAKSREFIRQASAAPAIQIYGYADDLAQARRWVHSGDVYGVLFIPRDYAKNLGSGRQANVEFYADMSLLLRYRALLSALTELQIKITGDVTMSRVEQAGAAGTISMPINSSSNFLGDTEQGFASFIMPGIVILILQQSMLLGITFIGEAPANAVCATAASTRSDPTACRCRRIYGPRALLHRLLPPDDALCRQGHTRDVQPAALRQRRRLSALPPAYAHSHRIPRTGPHMVYQRA